MEIHHSKKKAGNILDLDEFFYFKVQSEYDSFFHTQVCKSFFLFLQFYTSRTILPDGMFLHRTQWFIIMDHFNRSQ